MYEIDDDWDTALETIQEFCNESQQSVQAQRILFQHLERLRLRQRKNTERDLEDDVEDNGGGGGGGEELLEQWTEAGRKYVMMDPSSPWDEALKPLVHHLCDREQCMSVRGRKDLLTTSADTALMEILVEVLDFQLDIHERRMSVQQWSDRRWLYKMVIDCVLNMR